MLRNLFIPTGVSCLATFDAPAATHPRPRTRQPVRPVAPAVRGGHLRG